MTPTTSALAWTTEEVRVAGSSVRLRTAGRGAPLLVLHHDIGTPEQLPFYDALADRFTCCCPRIRATTAPRGPPGMRSVRDVAVVYQALLAERGLADVALVGLGFGGWIAAEMATMAPRAFRRLVLVGAMGIKPAAGEILDQALVSYIDYVRAGFDDQAAFERLFTRRAAHPAARAVGPQPRDDVPHRVEALHVQPDACRHLLGGVQTPTLDRVGAAGPHRAARGAASGTPRRCPRRGSASSDGAGHCVEMERPDALARGSSSPFAAGLTGRPHAPHVLHRAADVGVPRGRGAEASAPPR